jgi:hypothetical protein
VALALGIDTAAPVVGWRSPATRSCSGRSAWSAAPTASSARSSRARSAIGAIDVIGVTVGPGAFTGIRVGVGLALGVAMARGVPIVACSSLTRARCSRPGRAVRARRSSMRSGSASTPERSVPTVRHPRSWATSATRGWQTCCRSAPFVAVRRGALVFADALLAAGARIAPDPGASPALLVARMALAPGAVRLGPRKFRSATSATRGSPAPKLIAPKRARGFAIASLRAGLWICSMDRGCLPGSPARGAVEKRESDIPDPRAPGANTSPSGNGG